jgi:hypothetical protein
MDDFTIYGDDFQQALENLEKVLITCRETNLSLNHEKSRMMLTEGIVSSHHIFDTRIRVDPAKIDIISQIRTPSSHNEFRIFLGHAGYYRRFIQKFTKLVSPLFKLLAKEAELHWDEQCQISFEILKKKLSSALVLRGPNWSLSFHICIDASDTALGGILGQRENQLMISTLSTKISPLPK